MNKIKPFYVELLLAAIIIFSIGMTIMLSDMYYRICMVEHALCHIPQAPCQLLKK
jgi:hypothetical protein